MRSLKGSVGTLVKSIGIYRDLEESIEIQETYKDL